ncbi:MAG: PTS sugar transporter subunit IIA [Caulobacteraceae bacterium]
MDIRDLLDRRAILPLLTASSKRQVLTSMAEAAARAYGLDAHAAADALIAREKLGSTGAGLGVATPHARVPGLKQACGVFARLEQPIKFQAVDDQPVDLIFALFAPPGDDAGHLRALARVSRMLRRGDLREQLRNAGAPDTVYALLCREEVQGAAA